MLFWDDRDGLPRETGPGPVLSWRQVVKEHPSGENALGAPCSLREHLLTLRGKEYIAEGVMHPFLIMNSLRKPRKDAAESAAFRTRAFYRLVAAARKRQFGAKPGSAVAATALVCKFLLSQ
jgi:hypothetical protein